MKFGILEIIGLFLLVVGCGAIVGAASLVSLALAVLTAGVFLAFAGTLVVYVAVTLEKAAPKPAGDRR
jgi:hypothetical protein